jgi:hypothetical protein
MDDVSIFYGRLVCFVVIRYISPHFGILYQEKSGNPGPGGVVCLVVSLPSAELWVVRSNPARV